MRRAPLCPPTHDPGRQSPWKMPSWGNRGAARCAATEAGSRRSDSPRTWKTLRVSHISHTLTSKAIPEKALPTPRTPAPASVRRQPDSRPPADRRPPENANRRARHLDPRYPGSPDPLSPACLPGPGPRWLAAPTEPTSCVGHGASTSASTIPHTEFLTLAGRRWCSRRGERRSSARRCSGCGLSPPAAEPPPEPAPARREECLRGQERPASDLFRVHIPRDSRPDFHPAAAPEPPSLRASGANVSETTS